MKHKITLCTLLFLVGTQPIQAALLGAEDQPSSSAPPPTASAPKPATTTPSVAPTPTPAPSVPSVSPQPGMNIPQDLSKLSPEQSKQLLQQAKSLNPDQLQAIAKSFQQTQASPAQSEAPITVPSATPMPSASAPDGTPAAPRAKSLEEIKRDQAFGMLVDEVLPMSPDQITKIHKYYDMTLQAKATPPNPTAQPPAIRSEKVDLSPGSETPVIRLSAGFVTVINFTDRICGSPWKLASYSIGDPQTFNIQWDHKGNKVFIQSLKPYAHGNLAVTLWGLDTPIMLTLVANPRMSDFRVDLIVPGRNPECAAPTVESGGFSPEASVNQILINILDGVPPRGSIKLHVAGGPGEAWLVDNKIFFRSKLTILSPAWVSSVSSADGTHVYELMLTPSILASQNGKTMDIKLSGL